MPSITLSGVYAIVLYTICGSQDTPGKAYRLLVNGGPNDIEYIVSRTSSDIPDWTVLKSNTSTRVSTNGYSFLKIRRLDGGGVQELVQPTVVGEVVMRTILYP